MCVSVYTQKETITNTHAHPPAYHPNSWHTVKLYTKTYCEYAGLQQISGKWKRSRLRLLSDGELSSFDVFYRGVDRVLIFFYLVSHSRTVYPSVLCTGREKGNLPTEILCF